MTNKLHNAEIVALLEDAGEKLSSEDLAAIIIDALLRAGIVKGDEVERATKIASEEIGARSALVRRSATTDRLDIAGEAVSRSVTRIAKLGATSMAGRDELVIEIQQKEVAKWALEFALLLGGFVEQTEVRLENGFSILFRISSDSKADRTMMARKGENAFSCELSRTQAGYVQATLLRAYRDEMAEVNHIHVEGFLSDASFDLTLMFDTYRPPMSAKGAEEMIRRR